MRSRRVVALVCGCVMLLGPLTGTAGAFTPTRPAPPGVPVDLTKGWGNYGACLVKPDGAVECFADDKGLKARSDQLAMDQSGGAQFAGNRASTWCPVYLYSGPSYTGQILELTSRWFWMNLWDYGFDNRAVSFIGYSCGFHLADYAWGGGWWYPGYTGAWAYSPNMGAWNYRVSSVYIT